MEIMINQLHSDNQLNEWQASFEKHNIYRTGEYYSMCLQENIIGNRMTLFGSVNGVMAGCCHLKYISDYSFFKERNIPEINDLNVFSEFRRIGIANKLMDHMELHAAKFTPYIGIGVGLYKDYGSAQRIYCRRGYIPDGNGMIYHNEIVEPGSKVCVDDDLNLYFIKKVMDDENDLSQYLSMKE